MFYDKLLQLCSDLDMSPSAAAKAVGMTGAHVNKWKTGSTPNDTTVIKFANHYHISPKFFSGTEDESYYAWTEYQLHKAEREYASVKAPERRAALARDIDVLTESLNDQRLAMMLCPVPKRKTASITDEAVAEFVQELHDKSDRAVLFKRSKYATPEQLKAILALLPGGNDED